MNKKILLFSCLLAMMSFVECGPKKKIPQNQIATLVKQKEELDLANKTINQQKKTCNELQEKIDTLTAQLADKQEKCAKITSNKIVPKTETGLKERIEKLSNERNKKTETIEAMKAAQFNNLLGSFTAGALLATMLIYSYMALVVKNNADEFNQAGDDNQTQTTDEQSTENNDQTKKTEV